LAVATSEGDVAQRAPTGEFPALVSATLWAAVQIGGHALLIKLSVPLGILTGAGRAGGQVAGRRLGVAPYIDRNVSAGSR
jgi:hypothetical protein